MRHERTDPGLFFLQDLRSRKQARFGRTCTIVSPQTPDQSFSGIPNRGQKRANRPFWNVYLQQIATMLLLKNFDPRFYTSTSRPMFSRLLG
jgi:hypothetical protein